MSSRKKGSKRKPVRKTGRKKAAAQKTTRRRRGRPSVWENPMTEERVISAVRVGMTLGLAADFAGISFETLNQRRRSEPSFSERLTRAEAEGIFHHANHIRKAESSHQVHASKFFLATRRRDPWVAHKAVEHSGEVGVSLSDIARKALEAEGSEDPDDEGDGCE